VKNKRWLHAGSGQGKALLTSPPVRNYVVSWDES